MNRFYTPVASFARERTPQPGGFTNAQFIEVEKVNQIWPADPVTFISPGVQMKPPGYSWNDLFPPDNDKIVYQEEQKDSDAGPYMEITVTGVIPFDRKTNALLLDRLKYHRYIVQLMDRKKQFKRIIGSLDNPAVITHVFDIGNRGTAAAATVTFTARMEDKPLLT